jgi:polyhydroxyalkanoate synthesis regulator phasin
VVTAAGTAATRLSLVEGSEPEGGLPESLRAAIERTLAATAGPAAGTREPAQDLLDEVARRGHGQEARGRGADAIEELRLAGAREVRSLEGRLESPEHRIAALEEHEINPQAEDE